MKKMIGSIMDKQHETSPRFTLDDLHVGQRFTSRTHRIDEAEIKAFAGSFDPQPFHLDGDAARDSIFKGLAASGWHTAAITMRLNVEGGLPFAGGLVGAGADITWPTATRPGDILHVESEVVEIIPSRSRPDRGMAKIQSRTINQKGEVVQILNAKMILPRSTSPELGERRCEHLTSSTTAKKSAS